MDLLAYWKIENYRRDLDEGVGFHFNSKSSRLHTSLGLGDTLWMFTRIAGTSGVSEYRVVARLAVRAKTINPPSYKYGPFRVWGDLHLSEYFEITTNSSQDAFELLRLLPLDSGTFRECNRITLPQAAQTMRALKPEASRLLRAFCEQLPIEPRARAVPDERELEKSFEQDVAHVASVLEMPNLAYSPQKRAELIDSYPRNRKLVSTLNGLYAGRCQLCLFDSPRVYATNAAEAHHVIYRSRGGPDTFENLTLLCPNHHKVIHSTEARFDYALLHFIFPNGRVEPLCLNEHLKKRIVPDID